MSAGSDRLDRVCRAVADQTRRDLLDALDRTPGLTTGALAAHAPSVTRWAVMKHLAVLREAGLVQSLPEGRRRRHYRDDRTLEPLREWLARKGVDDPSDARPTSSLPEG